ncbi:type I restriction enzyme HsdR N-terminal domain-containing protein [Desulfurivibrio dismutans]|uniref:type I restriction enzyme HsdR N-terminal domain-containing protein n=1 Tax=Desulfurivibrio dismutans TaxID=1398908 RepID=UPI0023D991C0|nr:type I restriction enzyme HsdR N-terminal domain-containing protein [Desulfurivibrio alkaliphilus]MDF1613961.1 type I restriction enzyme HsdR N-terminal domain-containing protein [Desulfurivibrio alkaliphilus]
MTEVDSHHMTYGYLQDFLTGETLVDTDDERYRQHLARLLVEEKGFAKEEIESRLKIETLFAGRFVLSRIDFLIRLAGRPLLLLRYGPGSLVTRQRPALAAARVLDPQGVIPLTVVSNGQDAEVMDSYSGKVVAQGLGAIPARWELRQQEAALENRPLPAGQREPELRILNAFDYEACCAGDPCALPRAPEG